MKLSQISLDTLISMSTDEKWELNCSGIVDDGMTTEYALLLGGKPCRAIERAIGAAELYLQGRVKYIVASGGVKWEHNGKKISEAELMADVLIENGVPKDVIILENEATTTRENMIYGTLQINRKCRFNCVDGITIITSLTHMKRSLALAKAFMPRKLKIYAYPTFPYANKEEYLSTDENLNILNKSVELLKDLVDTNIIDDFEI